MTTYTKLVYHAKFIAILALSTLILDVFVGYIFIVELKIHLLHTASDSAVYAKNKQLKIYFLDIGQGDSIFIVTPDEHTLLIDGGPVNGGVLSYIGKILPFYKHSIDVVVETHPDADHIGGLPQVLKNYSVNLFLEPGLLSGTAVDRYLHEQIDEQKNIGLKELKARKGLTVVLDQSNSIYFQIFFPDRDVSDWTKRTNDASVVGKLTYASTTFLFTGDSPINIEDYLIKTLSTSTLQSTVLKVGHHGSKTSTSPEYVSAVQPEYGIISVGKDNRYGHPHEQAINNLISDRVKILRTDKLGTIEFISDGVSVHADSERIK